MASIKEIIEKEESSSGIIHLYLEGIFWKAYQASAYRLVQRMEKLKVTKKYVKTVDREVVSVGFPDSALLKYFREDEINRIGEKNITVACDVALSGYLGWFSGVSSAAGALGASGVLGTAGTLGTIGTTGTGGDLVLMKIREFNLEAATPMQCMIFLASIRQELHGSL